MHDESPKALVGPHSNPTNGPADRGVRATEFGRDRLGGSREATEGTRARIKGCLGSGDRSELRRSDQLLRLRPDSRSRCTHALISGLKLVVI
jgi:hypothetical protein